MTYYSVVARVDGRVRLEIPYQSYEIAMEFLYVIAKVASWYEWTLERQQSQEGA